MGKTVIITGGTRGIGAAIAKTFAKKGYNVAITCQSQNSFESHGKDVVAQCLSYGVDADCYVTNVANFQQCEELIKKVVVRFGTIDVLINNAGITDDTLLVRMKEEQFDRVIDTNLKGAFNMIRHVSPLMWKKKSGRIINIGSIVGLHGNPGQFNYCASKAGVIGMTKSAAKELGVKGITVNAIAPGFISTQMTDSLPDKIKDMMITAIPLKKFGRPQDVAYTALFLASDSANYITGQVIEVDGGMII